MTDSATKRRAQLLRLVKRQGSRCHFCACVMVVTDRRGQPKAGKLLEDEATLDHLDSRYSPERGKHAGEIRRVAACNRCNAGRAKVEQQSVPLEERRRRAKNGEPRKPPWTA